MTEMTPLNEPVVDLSAKVTPRERNLALTSMALGTFIFGTAEFGIMGLLPGVAEYFHTTDSNASHLIAAYALGVVIGGPIFAIACAKFAKRNLLLLLLSVFFIGNVGQTMMPTLFGTEIMRFISGLPHGAYFGVASLVGASLMPIEHRGRAIGIVLSGIPVATIIGVPLCTYINQWVDWTVLYMSLNVGLALCMTAIFFTIPYYKPKADINIFSELFVLKDTQVLMTLLTGAIGFGGMFGAYSFLTVALRDTTGLTTVMITVAQIIWGVGMFIGNNLGGALVDKNLDKTIIGSLFLTVVFLCGYSFFLPFQIPTLVMCFLVPLTAIMLSVGLQTRMTFIANEGQTLAASLHHSAFNAANALGASVAGSLVDYGYGVRSLGYGGAVLTFSGMIIYIIAINLKSGKDAHA